MIRVAHVNVAKSYRGGERQTELLIRELAKGGMTQRLIARHGAPLIGRFGDVDIDLVAVSGNFLGVARAARGVDLIHVHEGRSIYGAYLRHMLSGTPYIATRRVDNPIKQHRIAHAAYRHAAFVVAVAPTVGEIVRAYDPAIRLRVVHSGSSGLAVDARRSAEIRQSIGGDLVVGHVGALDNSQKAQEHIITVARRMCVTHPELRFVLVGGGADEAMLKNLAAGLSNVIFTGFVENVGDYLATFDIFILPSRREGIGSILLDAMEQRLPIVATRVGGVPDIVRDGENGLLIDPDRPDELCAAIERLAAAPAERARLGASGAAIARNFTAEVMARKYRELYDLALAS